MARLVTLFTGQWADIPFDDMARKTREFGFDGIELACWGDHFEVDKALADDGYCARKREQLEKHDLQCEAISAHLVGQAVLDNIDERHQAIVPDYVWGDGDPEGVRQRASEEMKSTARAARRRSGGNSSSALNGSPPPNAEGIWRPCRRRPPLGPASKAWTWPRR